MSESDGKPDRRTDITEKSKGYAVIMLTAATYIGLMFVSTAGAVYFLGQSIDPNVIDTVASMSQHQIAPTAWEFLSALVIGINGILSYVAYTLFRKWFRLHNQNLAHRESFKPKFWPIVGMGFVIAGAVSVIGGLIAVTHTTLHGLDPVSIYQALHSGSIYGIMSVMIFLPILGVSIIWLGPKTYHVIDDWERRHPQIPEFPDELGKKKDQNKP